MLAMTIQTASDRRRPRGPSIATRSLDLLHSEEAEDSALGAALVDDGAAEILVRDLTRDDFMRPSSAVVFDAIRDLHGSGLPVDATTVVHRLRGWGRLDDAGGQLRLLDL